MGSDRNYDKGQSDGSTNTYDPPVPIGVADTFLWPSDTLKKWEKLNDSYDKGWSNGYKQR